MAQFIKNLPAIRRPRLDRWDGKIPWRRERLPTHSSILACRIPMDRAWCATIHGVAKSQIWLSDFHFTHWLWETGTPSSSLFWCYCDVPWVLFRWGFSVVSVWGSETLFWNLNLLYTAWGTSSGRLGRIFVLEISFWWSDLETVWVTYLMVACLGTQALLP